MSLTEPIVDGAYYELPDGSIDGPSRNVNGVICLGSYRYKENGDAYSCLAPRLIRRVWLVYADPADVVAEFRACACAASGSPNSGRRIAYEVAADLVAKKLGVK